MAFPLSPNRNPSSPGKARRSSICYGQISLELKAVKAVAPEQQAQMLDYLKSTGLRLGLILNFGDHPKAQIERFAR